MDQPQSIEFAAAQAAYKAARRRIRQAEADPAISAEVLHQAHEDLSRAYYKMRHIRWVAEARVNGSDIVCAFHSVTQIPAGAPFDPHVAELGAVWAAAHRALRPVSA